MRIFKNFIFFFLISNAAFAQSPLPEGAGLQLSVSVGRIVPHSPKFKAAVRGITTSAELNYVQQTDGKARWHHTHRLPTIGLAATYHNFGDPEVFGEALGIMPNIAFSTRPHSRKWYTYVRVGMGLAYLTKPFNALTNPTNTVIGQNLNNITDIKGGFGFWLSPNTELVASAGITHFSDAAAQLPNLGINVPALSLALRYTPQPIVVYKNNDTPDIPAKRWHAFAQADYGINEQIGDGGPKYFIASTTAGALYDFSERHHFFAGATYEFSESTYHWTAYQYPYTDKAVLFDRASRVAIFVGDEFRFGQFAFGIALAGYVKDPKLAPFIIYEKLAARYYFLPKKTIKPYINLQLKAHLSVAEYASFGGGFLF
jgi:Lipid A 3-O-deacylase (PagL)